MKQRFLERVSREMAEDFPAADLPPREALAAACRILARSDRMVLVDEDLRPLQRGSRCA